jgi:hypothetical protein
VSAGTRFRFSGLVRIDQLITFLFPLSKGTDADLLIAVFLENRRGTRGATTVISSGDDEHVLGNLGDPRLELAERNVDVTGNGAEPLDFLWLADVQEEKLGFAVDDRFQIIRTELLDLILSGPGDSGQKESENNNI